VHGVTWDLDAFILIGVVFFNIFDELGVVECL